MVTSIFYTVLEENRAGIHDNRYDIKSDTAERKSWIGERSDASAVGGMSVALPKYICTFDVTPGKTISHMCSI